MASNNQIKEEFEISVAVWNLFKKYVDIKPKTDSIWKQIIDEVHEIEKKYHSKFCNELLITYINHLERLDMKDGM